MKGFLISLRLALQGQQAVLAGGLGQADQLVDQRAGMFGFAEERLLEDAEDVEHLLQGETDQRDRHASRRRPSSWPADR